MQIYTIIVINVFLKNVSTKGSATQHKTLKMTGRFTLPLSFLEKISATHRRRNSISVKSCTRTLKNTRSPSNTEDSLVLSIYLDRHCHSVRAKHKPDLLKPPHGNSRFVCSTSYTTKWADAKITRRCIFSRCATY